MYRRVVSLALLPCLLLSQTAVLGHAHGGGQPAGHDLRPHFHTAPTGHGHHHDDSDGHSHHVHHRHHHHDEDGGHTHADVDETRSEPAPRSPPTQPDHDDDAFFVAAVDATVSPRPQTGDEDTTAAWWVAVGLIPSAAAWDRPQTFSPTRGPPPPDPGPHCPLYVRYLALLI